MKTRVLWLQAIFLIVIVGVLAAMAFRPAPPARRKAVVVELFTSEGCSSCPPADELLTRMEHQSSSNGAEIIPLGFHVDYWNELGWKDRFSSHAYTDRQQKYAARFRLDGPYTPQMVVDGQSEFVGNDSGHAQNAITQATTRQQQADVTLKWTSPEKLLVVVNSTDKAVRGEVRLAITEDNLSTTVAAGENNGHVLRHSAVVRDFRLLGQLSDGSFQKEISVQPQKDWKVNDLRAVAFVQGQSEGEITGASSIAFIGR